MNQSIYLKIVKITAFTYNAASPPNDDSLIEVRLKRNTILVDSL